MNTDITYNNTEMSDLFLEIMYCKKCFLHKSRTCSVPGAGKRYANLMVVGEGPGEKEDKQGLPFVGRSGQFLTETLGRIGLNREDIFITNVVKCRPPKNRDPLPTEILTCRSYLEKQISLVQPKVIVALGRIAASHLLDRKIQITKEHGKLEILPSQESILVSIVYHPSYVLRNLNTQVEQDFYNDLLEARNIACGTLTNPKVFKRGFE